VSVIDNLIRNAHIGIGVSIDRCAGTALITDNLISGAKDGAIRAMNGPTPTGPDLARASAEAFPNLAVYSNVARRDAASTAAGAVAAPIRGSPARRLRHRSG
jgi:hypothetical protein